MLYDAVATRWYVGKALMQGDTEYVTCLARVCSFIARTDADAEGQMMGKEGAPAKEYVPRNTFSVVRITSPPRLCTHLRATQRMHAKYDNE